MYSYFHSADVFGINRAHSGMLTGVTDSGRVECGVECAWKRQGFIETEKVAVLLGRGEREEQGRGRAAASSCVKDAAPGR